MIIHKKNILILLSLFILFQSNPLFSKEESSDIYSTNENEYSEFMDWDNESGDDAGEDIKEDKFSIYGYVVNLFQTRFFWSSDKDAKLGDSLVLRLKGDWKPQDKVKFHTEIAYYMRAGDQNPYPIMDVLAILNKNTNTMQANNPHKNFFHDFDVDHVWGLVNLGIFDLQFGKMPIAWGTGYIFNPTARVATPNFLFMDMVTEETKGVLGIVPSIAIGNIFSIEGYLAFQDKLQKTVSFKEDGLWKNIPWGVRLKAIAGSFDLSISWFKEVMFLETGYNRNYFAGFDFVGWLGSIGIYGECSLKFPMDSLAKGLVLYKYNFYKNFEAVLGFEYTIPKAEIELRSEYFYQGPGEYNKENYNIGNVLSGMRLVQARHYLFLYASREFKTKFKILTGSIINFNDGSFVIFPEFTYDPLDNFQMMFGVFFYGADSGDEFSGEYAAMPVDFIENYSIYLRFKLSF